mgnify:CR=1 FL=1
MIISVWTGFPRMLLLTGTGMPVENDLRGSGMLEQELSGML